jgi:hypothetical protein
MPDVFQPRDILPGRKIRESAPPKPPNVLSNVRLE